jgi:hypothetical protein
MRDDARRFNPWRSSLPQTSEELRGDLKVAEALHRLAHVERRLSRSTDADDLRIAVDLLT